MHRSRSLSLLPLAAAAATLAAAAPASADTLLTKLPAGSTNLATGGGVHAWAQPEGDGFRLVVRDADGTVRTPAIKAFAKAPDPAIGTVFNADFSKRLLVVYDRGGDLRQLDLASGKESAVKGASTKRYRETAPSINEGRIAFVRSGGERNGVFDLSTRTGRLRRVSKAIATATAHNGTRVAYVTGQGITIRRVSGRGRALKIGGAGQTSLNLTRYNAAWLGADGTVARTDRFAGSGGPYTLKVFPAKRQVDGIVSLAVGESVNVASYIDGEGLKRGDATLLR